MAPVKTSAEGGMAIGRSLGAVLLALASLAGGPRAAALASERPNLMIVGEDADRSSVPRGSRVFNRVLAAIANDMIEQGFQVYDETAASMGITRPGKMRRTDAELIDIARSIQRPPIDVIVAFQIYASAQPSPYSRFREPRVRIAGRLIQMYTAKMLGSFEAAVGPRGLRPLPPNCFRNCELEHFGDDATPIAHAVGTALARRLDELMPTGASTIALEASPSSGAGALCGAASAAYTIVLDGFDPDDTFFIEQRLAAFMGYEQLRLLRARTRFAEYWYETCSDLVRLERNLQSVLEQMGGVSRLALSGNRFEITRIVGARERGTPDAATGAPER
jgi:hypothetical protein